MVLKIQLLGLFISWFLIMIYYTKKREDRSCWDGNFRGMLVVNYLVQLLYLVTAIASNNQSFEQLYGKLYWFSIFVFFAVFSKYMIEWIWRQQAQHQQTKLEHKLRIHCDLFLIGIGMVGLVLGIFIKDVVQNNMLIYKESIMVWLLLFLVILNIFRCCYYQKKIEVAIKSKFLFLNFFAILVIILQYCFEGLSILNTGILFITFYLEQFLEDPLVKRMEILQLERDQALYQSIDKSTFLRTLSHEIRTPLNTIDGFSQVIIDTNDLKEIKDDVRDIRIASKDLIDTIHGMIDLSIIETGELQIIPENYNIYDLIDNVSDLIQSKMKDEKVSFVVDMEKNIPAVLLGDSERISQVILGLLKNSIKYTEKGKIELAISSVKSASICRLKIVVKDTGKGMNEEELFHMFEYENEKQGYNLNLRVVKYLVELMNGKLDIKSAINEGSTFTITIDQKIISEVAQGNDQKKKVIKPFKAEDKRILIVDDNKLNLKVASKLLAPYLVEIVEANSGQECLDILEKDTNFDLILMDDLMPSMSGTQTLDILKKIQRVDGYYIPVVVLTANAVSGMKEQYLNAGFEDYLSKPIEKEELHRILTKYLKKSDK